ncbi:MAG: molybdopterin-binding protein [Chloroflexi bacterium]|nr:molybdopterin-binding protein [Chloroflexota bacterium]
MPEFFNVLAPEEAFEVLRKHLSVRVDSERVSTSRALGRVTATNIVSPEDLPSFPRSTMDGYSVRAADTFGATEGLPAYLELAGAVPMGAAPQVSLGPGEASGAFTGGMLAVGADAVVMEEHTQRAGETTIEVMRPVAPGENVLQVGEDVRVGDEVLPAGHVIRPQDVGGLTALGITEIDVARRPVVVIVSTGDELVPPNEAPGPGQVRDINTYTISALVEKHGGVPVPVALVEDDYEAQRDAAVGALDKGDVLVFSAGSSISSRDLTASVIDSLGSPGVLVHGISLKPGKPTIVALIDGKPAFGLPGNPVSAMVVFNLLVRPTLYLLAGCEEPPEPATVTARLARDVASVAGREDHVQVRLNGTENGRPTAEPVFGKSNLIYSLVRADGTITVPLDKAGLYAGEEVEVRLF